MHACLQQLPKFMAQIVLSLLLGVNVVWEIFTIPAEDTVATIVNMSERERNEGKKPMKTLIRETMEAVTTDSEAANENVCFHLKEWRRTVCSRPAEIHVKTNKGPIKLWNIDGHIQWVLHYFVTEFFSSFLDC